LIRIVTTDDVTTLPPLSVKAPVEVILPEKMQFAKLTLTGTPYAILVEFKMK
jgi:hypothetical protein